MNDDFELEDRFRSAIGSLPVLRGPDRPPFLYVPLVQGRRTPWLGVLAAAAVLIVSGLAVVAGFQVQRPPATDASAGAPTPAATAHPTATFDPGGLYWRLTKTSVPVPVPQTCPFPAASVGQTTEYLLDVRRGPNTVTLLYDIRNYPTDNYPELRGTVVGDSFTAASSVTNPAPPTDAGIVPTVCGLQGAWQLDAQVVGQFSPDGRLLTGKETWTYRFPTGHTLVQAWDWKAIAPSAARDPRPTPSPSPTPRPTIPPPTSVEFEVFVLDDDGAPLPDAVVTIAGGAWRTDAAGRAIGRTAIEPSWETKVRATKAGYDDAEVRTVTSVWPRELFHLHKPVRVLLDESRTMTLSANDRDPRCSWNTSAVHWLSGAVGDDDFGGYVNCRVVTITSRQPFLIELSAPTRLEELGFVDLGCRSSCGPRMYSANGVTAIGVVRHTRSADTSFDNPDPITFTIRAVVAP